MTDLNLPQRIELGIAEIEQRLSQYQQRGKWREASKAQWQLVQAKKALLRAQTK